jgi:hypothetical protein
MQPPRRQIKLGAHIVSLFSVCAAFADFCRHLAEKIFGNFPIIDLDKSIIIRASLFSLLLHVRSAWRAASKNEPNNLLLLLLKSDAIYTVQFATQRK